MASALAQANLRDFLEFWPPQATTLDVRSRSGALNVASALAQANLRDFLEFWPPQATTPLGKRRNYSC